MSDRFDEQVVAVLDQYANLTRYPLDHESRWLIAAILRQADANARALVADQSVRHDRGGPGGPVHYSGDEHGEGCSPCRIQFGHGETFSPQWSAVTCPARLADKPPAPPSGDVAEVLGERGYTCSTCGAVRSMHVDSGHDFYSRAEMTAAVERLARERDEAIAGKLHLAGEWTAVVVQRGDAERERDEAVIERDEAISDLASARAEAKAAREQGWRDGKDEAARQAARLKSIWSANGSYQYASAAAEVERSIRALAAAPPAKEPTDG